MECFHQAKPCQGAEPKFRNQDDDSSRYVAKSKTLLESAEWSAILSAMDVTAHHKELLETWFLCNDPNAIWRFDDVHLDGPQVAFQLVQNNATLKRKRQQSTSDHDWSRPETMDLPLLCIVDTDENIWKRRKQHDLSAPLWNERRIPGDPQQHPNDSLG